MFRLAIFAAMLTVVLSTTYLGPKTLISKNYPNYRIGEKNGNHVYIVNSGNPGYRIVQGLNGKPGTVSFQSLSDPSAYLRHRGFLAYVDKNDNTQLFKDDASFVIIMNKYFNGYAAFQSSNYPNRYLRHQGYRIKLHTDDGSVLFKNDASFKIETMAVATTHLGPKTLTSKNYPNYRIGEKNGNHVYIINSGNPGYKIVQGLNGKPGTVSFQSLSDPSAYLRHRGFLAYVDKNDNSQLFKDDASFVIIMNKYFNGYAAFQSSNYPSRYLRHQGYRIKLHEDDGSLLFKNDASFKISKMRVAIKYEAKAIIPYKYPAFGVGVFGDWGRVYALRGHNHGFRIVKGINRKPGTISFQSLTAPSSYLQHKGSSVYVRQRSRSRYYVNSASFYLIKDKFFKGFAVFESSTRPGYYLQLRGRRMMFRKYNGSRGAREQSSFRFSTSFN
ncbi:uncharacterized protein LOC130636763 [Hydractinia symbiolongicarpus]|uniref:uncharacterized protein LOC130636763 n=1 Tax=Hydractinia symbiolongicarpus TaxID=13093 RepID=UPI00254BBADC|nr:uncharacterized protein LOC130636763 [Hydractinia symbiolongicarpus]XP_057302598.1 uncharacterized protein LOC130636763 [Hydractinia symbiolongicarpus]